MENGEYNSNQANPNDIADGSKDVRKTRAESRENQENAPNDKGCAPELKDNAQDGMKCGDKSHHAADNSPTERQNANKSGIRSSETMMHAHMLPPQTMLRRSVRFREIRLSPSNAFRRRKSETFKSASFRFCCAAKDAHPGAHDDCRHTQRSRRLWLICGATRIVIAMLRIQVRNKHRDINLGYR